MARQAAQSIENMADLREAIDDIDCALLDLLAERLTYIDRAPALKKREGIAARAPSRVADVLAKVRVQAERSGFDADVAEAMWQIMIEAMIAREERVIGTQGLDK